ncbi:hypothetical protein ACFOOP_19740 [Marinicaulis aureus]|uniref:Lipoprotein n=1 Tax=Hyphococcus aureus TaxID=2666033 RepID=A0ABW1KUY5_9PROT
MQTLITDCLRILLVAIMMAGCSTTPKEVEAKEFDAYAGCLVAPNKWRQIAAPPNREVLLDLPEKISSKPVRSWFGSADSLREVWFESSSGDELQACRYNPQKSCYNGGSVISVSFKKLESRWEAGPAKVSICSH